MQIKIFLDNYLNYIPENINVWSKTLCSTLAKIYTYSNQYFKFPVNLSIVHKALNSTVDGPEFYLVQQFVRLFLKLL